VAYLCGDRSGIGTLGRGVTRTALSAAYAAGMADLLARLADAVPTVAVPDLAGSTPLWLALLTVYVAAIVGALRGLLDTSRDWDLVGVSAFALLMGLGGGFIRDLLIGNLPAESLRSPWFLAAVVAGIVTARVGDRAIARLDRLFVHLNALALGLFAVVGAAYATAFGLPFVSAVVIGTLSAVGGGAIVSVLQGEVPRILLAGAPNALLAVWGSVAYLTVARWNAAAASFVGIATVLIAQAVSLRLGLTTRPTHGRRPSAAV
jgi:uncharacterized membrane protein YeiH